MTKITLKKYIQLTKTKFFDNIYKKQKSQNTIKKDQIHNPPRKILS